MDTILVWKEQLQSIYAKYSIYTTKVLQFILGLCVFGLINSNVGFMKAAASVVCTLGLAAVCAFLPLVVMVVTATALILLHFYTLSMPIAIVTLMLFLIMYIFYFRFTPQKSWLVLLTPIAFTWNIPFVIPIIFGLLGTPIFVIPAAFGTIVYYMLQFVKGSSSALKGGDTKNIVESLMAFTKQSLSNKEMWVMVAVVVVGLLVVYAVRTRSVDHAWKIGTVTGVIGAIVIGAGGSVALNVHLSYGSMVVSGLAAILTGLILEFLFFSVNYARTERMQFEDDEYCYYVKAVPKIVVSAPQKRVKHINERRDGQEAIGMDSLDMNTPRKGGAYTQTRRTPDYRYRDKRVSNAKATDEILLTRSLTKELGLDLEDLEKK